MGGTIVGIESIKYEKNGKTITGTRVHLLLDPLPDASPNFRGQKVDSVYIPAPVDYPVGAKYDAVLYEPTYGGNFRCLGLHNIHK